METGGAVRRELLALVETPPRVRGGDGIDLWKRSDENRSAAEKAGAQRESYRTARKHRSIGRQDVMNQRLPAVAAGWRRTLRESEASWSSQVCAVHTQQDLHGTATPASS